MRKLLSFTLAFVISASALVLVGEASSGKVFAGSPNKISLAGNENMTTAVATENTSTIEKLDALIQAGVAVNKPPAGYTNTATITASLKNGNNTHYNVLVSGENLFIERNANFVAINRADWNSFTNALGGNFYKFKDIPVAYIAKTPLVTVSSTYNYQKVDGYYYTPNLKESLITPPSFIMYPGQTLKLSHSLAPTAVSLNISLNGKTLWSGPADELSSFKPETGGDFTAIVTSEYSSGYYRGTVASKAILKYPATAIDFSIEGNSTYPGELVVLKAKGVTSADSITFKSDIDFTPRFFPSGDDYIALMPVSYFTSLGEHYISLASGETAEKFSIKVNDKKFQIQNLTVDSTTSSQTIESQKANEEYEKAIAPIRKVAHNTAYWQGTPFVWPVGKDARVTTEFGMIRYVNGKATSVRHGAIDFAVPLGTPVKATNNGVVLYSGFLQLTGNTVVVEHGYGLKSWHYHMDTRNVKTNDTIKAGDILGTVGTTGFSTGPHLHFGFSVNNVFVNPKTIIDTDLLE